MNTSIIEKANYKSELHRYKIIVILAYTTPNTHLIL